MSKVVSLGMPIRGLKSRLRYAETMSFLEKLKAKLGHDPRIEDIRQHVLAHTSKYPTLAECLDVTTEYAVQRTQQLRLKAALKSIRTKPHGSSRSYRVFASKYEKGVWGLIEAYKHVMPKKKAG